MKKIWLSSIFSLFLLGSLVAILQAQEPASAFWGTIDVSGNSSTTFGVYDSNNTTVLVGNDVVQFIWVGPNGVIDEPNYNGTPGGDDQMIDSSAVVVDGSVPPPFRNRGYVNRKLFSYDTSAAYNGGQVYIRAWNFSAAGGYNGATFYGESSLMTLNGTEAQELNYSRWFTNKSATAPDIAVYSGPTELNSSSNVAVGSTLIGTPLDHTFTITNVGVDNLTLGSITVPAGFTVLTPPSSPVPGQSSTTFVVRLTAAAPGTFSGQVAIPNNDPNENPFTFNINGTVTAPSVQVFDGSTPLVNNSGVANFGVTTPSTPITKTFTITNSGTGQLNLSNLTVTGSDFVIVAPGFGSSTVLPGQSTTFRVRFNALAEGTVNATVSFNNNDGNNNPFSFTVQGTVAVPEVTVLNGLVNVPDDSTVNVGSTVIGTPITRTFTVRNDGLATLTLSNLNLSNITGSQFVLAQGFGSSSLAPGASTTFRVRVEGTVISNPTAVVTFNNNDSNENPFSINLTAAVSAAPAPEIELTFDGVTNIEIGNTADYSTTLVGTPVIKTFTITNNGTANLTLSGLNVNNTTGSQFGIFSGFSTTTVTPGNTATFQIRLLANSAGSPAATITFNNNDSNEGSYSFFVVGEVLAFPEIVVLDNGTVLNDGSSVNFGTTTFGFPITKTFTISNSGTAVLTLADLDITGSAFEVVQGFGSSTVNPGNSTTFVVRLTANTLGAAVGALSFTNNDGDENPFNLSLNGQVDPVLEPEIVVEESSIEVIDGSSTVNFGSTGVDVPVVKTFTVFNNGTAALTLANLQVNNTVGSQFVIASNFISTTLAPGQNTTFQIRLQATVPGSPAATVSFANNDATENPFSFGVTGVVNNSPEVVVRLDSVVVGDGSTADFGSTALGFPITKTFEVQNIGTANLNVANLVITGTDYVEAAGFSNLSIAPNQTATFAVRLNATMTGTLTGTVIFENNDATENPYNITLTAEVTFDPEPEVQLLDGATDITDGTGTVDFGTTPMGLPVIKTFVVRNIGTANLTASNLVVPAGFEIVNDLDGNPIPPGQQDVFQLALTATAVGSYNGQISFTTNDADENPFNFMAEGEVVPAPEAEVRLDGLVISNEGLADFGSTSLGNPLTQTFELHNLGGSPLSVSNLVVDGAPYTITLDFEENVIPAGDSTQFMVTLGADAIGTFTATLTFDTTDPDENPYIVYLTGNVTTNPEPEIQVLDGNNNILDGEGQVGFGTTVVGTPITKTITIRNIGQADLLVSNLTVPAGFAIISDLPTAPIPADGSVTIVIQLEADNLGTMTGELSFTTNDSDENPFNFTISGTVEENSNTPVIYLPIVMRP